MARNHDEIVQEVRDWKNFISSVDNIPLNPNHTYKDENDVYERLNEYVKDWAESVFGVYTNAEGAMVNLPEDEEGPECKAWLEEVGSKVTSLPSNWYQIALKGAKGDGLSSLPQMNQNGLDDPQNTAVARDDIQKSVQSTFFPAYRALRDSFENRSWLQWIFNHRRYTAERDALKAMTSLITSMTGYTKKELDAQYVQHKKDFTAEEIANSAIELSNRQVNINEPVEEELFKNEDIIDRKVQLKDNRLVEGLNDELFTDMERYDDYFITDEQKEEMNKRDFELENEPIVDNLPAQEKLEKYDTKEDIDTMCVKFLKVFRTNESNEESIYRAMHIHLYPQLAKAANFLCMKYDAIKRDNEGADSKQEFFQRSAKSMFEVAFKALGTEDSREVVKNVRGKEVREKIGGSVFNVTNLKDRIVIAQRVANLMLKHRTPIGFYPELSASEYTKGYHVLEKTDQLRTFLKENYADKYGELQISVAIDTAKNVLGARFRGETLKPSPVFEIGYRPDPAKLEAEQKVLGEAQKMLMSKLIKDEGMKNIIAANVEKWKEERDMQKPNAKLNRNAIEKKWIEADKKFAETYKDYDATATKNAVENARVEYDEIKKAKAQAGKVKKSETTEVKQEPIKVELQEPQAQIVPPVQPKPAEIKPPVSNK